MKGTWKHSFNYLLLDRSERIVNPNERRRVSTKYLCLDGRFILDSSIMQFQEKGRPPKGKPPDEMNFTECKIIMANWAGTYNGSWLGELLSNHRWQEPSMPPFCETGRRRRKGSSWSVAAKKILLLIVVSSDNCHGGISFMLYEVMQCS